MTEITGRLDELLRRASDGLADDILRAAGIPVRDGASRPMTGRERQRALRVTTERLSTVYGTRRGAVSPLQRLIVEGTTDQWASVLAREGRVMQEALGKQLADAIAAGNEDVRTMLEMSRSAIPSRLEMARQLNDVTEWIDQRGYQLSDRVWSSRNDLRRRIDTQLRLGIARGTDALKIAKELEQFLTPVERQIGTRAPGRGGRGTYGARRLARTEITRALGNATALAAQANPMVDGLKWLLSARHPEFDICDDYAGQDRYGLGPGVYPVNALPPYPPHPMCFPAGTIVSGSTPVASTTRWYDGDLVEVVTASGKFLSGTPNHPILTDQGWVAIGLLQQGDNVISTSLGQGPIASNPDDEAHVSLIEDVAESLRRSGRVATVSVPVSAEDFHGDGTDGEVSIVSADGFLRLSVKAALLEPLGQKQLSRVSITKIPLACFSNLCQMLFRTRLAPDCRVSSFSVLPALFRASLCYFYLLGFTHRSRRHTSRKQVLANVLALYAVLLSQSQFRHAIKIQLGNDRITPSLRRALHSGFRQQTIHVSRRNTIQSSGDLCGLPGNITPDRVLNVRRRDFSGHVFNLQTTGEWYIANGIIVHNCLCTISPFQSRSRDQIVADLRRQYGLDQEAA